MLETIPYKMHSLLNAEKEKTHLMYDEYIFMNAACDKNVSPTFIATFTERLPSESAATPPGTSNALDASSRAGKKLSLWKVRRVSRPPKTIFRSFAGMTVSLPDVPSALTGAQEGLM